MLQCKQLMTTEKNIRMFLVSRNPGTPGLSFEQTSILPLSHTALTLITSLLYPFLLNFLQYLQDIYRISIVYSMYMQDNIGNFSTRFYMRIYGIQSMKEVPIRQYGKKNDVHVDTILNDIQDVSYLGLSSCADKID